MYLYRVPDTVPKGENSAEHSGQNRNHDLTQNHGNGLKSEISPSRDLFFFPEKNKKLNYESASNIESGHAENHRKNLVMPVRSAIFILKNGLRISEDTFLEFVRVLKVLKARGKMKIRMRRAVETVDEGEMEACLRDVQGVRAKEVRGCEITRILTDWCFV